MPRPKDGDNGSPIIISDSSRGPKDQGSTTFVRGDKNDVFEQDTDTEFHVQPSGFALDGVSIPGFDTDDLSEPWTIVLGNGDVLSAADNTGVSLLFHQKPSPSKRNAKGQHGVKTSSGIGIVVLVSDGNATVGNLPARGEIEITFAPVRGKKR
jgi:hypothetical protein